MIYILLMSVVVGALIGLIWAGCSYLNGKWAKPKKPKMLFNFTDKQRTALQDVMHEMLTVTLEEERNRSAKIVEHHGRNCLHMNAFCAKKIAADVRAGKVYGEFEKVIHDRPDRDLKWNCVCGTRYCDCPDGTPA